MEKSMLVVCRRAVPLLIAGLLLVVTGPASALGTANAWTPSRFPNPKTDLQACGRGGVPSNICDPDLLLSSEAKDYVEGVLKAIWHGEEPYKTAQCGGKAEGYQVAVAVMRALEVPAGASPEAAAHDFAKALHDAWGVGDPACNNGVLFLLAVDNRQVYISTGKGAAATLTGARIADVVSDIRPDLRRTDYDAAVKRAVVDIGLGLAGGGPKGEGVDWTGVAFFGIIAALMSNTAWKSIRRRRQYRDCKRMLEKLKREQENLRSHAWSCPQSCPICLEDFTVHPSRRGGGSSNVDKVSDDGASTSAAGAGSSLDAEAGPSTSLLGAASDDEFARMSAAGQAAVRRLRQRRRGGASGSGGGSTAGSSSGMLTDGPVVGHGAGAKGNGEDGGRRERLPVTLGCGHTFCEPCIESWLDKGTTCPVCRKPISEGSGQEGGAPSDQSSSQQQRQRVADDWLATDLAFRLAVLQGRYPMFITPTMVDTWSSEAQATGSFSWESSRDFQLNDPAAQHHYQSSGGGGFGSAFGGGSGFGGGGGGGSW